MFKYLKLLCKIVEKKGQEIAYKINNDYITYEKLWEKANELAISLMGEGDSAVVVFGNKSINMLISIIACLIANRPYVPVDLHVPFDRIEKIIEFSGSTLVICNEEITVSNAKCMDINRINKTFYKKPKIDTTKNNIAYIMFTSGSTGEPKGVPISYSNLESFVEWILKMIPNKSNIELNVLNQASFSFDLSVADLYYSLLNGYKLIALDKKAQDNYEDIFKVLFNEEINLMIVTPTFVKLLMINNEFYEKNYPKLKCIYFCGEQLEVSMVRKLKTKFPNIEIINAYGPTEATSAVCGVIINEEMLEKKYLPVGVISEAATEIRIIDNEIMLKGKSVFNGYMNITSESHFKENNINCFKTGDVGEIENGMLYCFGRKDNQIKYMGYRIELGDIENNLLEIDEITEAVVIPKYDKNNKLVKNMKAFITVSKDISVEYVKNKLKQKIPQYMIPKIIVITDRIPTNENGKYDRKKLMNL